MSSLAQDLQQLRALKDAAEKKGRAKKEADAEFKQHQYRCLARMEAEESKRFGTEDYLFTTVFDRVKGRIEDRRKYVRWALENDEAIAEFLEWLLDDGRGAASSVIEDRFFDAITSTSVVQYKESQMIMNQQARACLDDGAPMPPGMTFDPDPSIRMTKS